MTTHKAIREALEAGPTEGPWFEHHDKGHLYIENQRDDVVCDMGLRAKSSPTSQFIAACNPAAIRALLADLDAKTAEVERLRALRPVAMTEWQQLDAARLNSEEFSGMYWLAMKYGEVAVGEYEWRQGWNPHGFNLIDGGGRVGALEVTHTIPFVKPALPHGITQKEHGK